MVLYSKFTYGFQFSEEKNGLEHSFSVPEILKKYKRSIFFGTPCTMTSPRSTTVVNSHSETSCQKGLTFWFDIKGVTFVLV